LDYDEQSNSFKGWVENITIITLAQVRVEIHLSNGTELGPTTPVDLSPGQITEVELMATGRVFDRWTPHVEVGTGNVWEREETGRGSMESREHGISGTSGGEHRGIGEGGHD